MTTPALALRRVSLRFGNAVATDDVELHVARGERVALLGPSGAGKSTLLGIAAGRVVPDAGEVEVLGQSWADRSAQDERRLRARIAVVHQQLDLVGPLRVVHNVNAGRYGTWSNLRVLRSLVRPVEVAEAAETLALVGLADRLGERTDRLSGGEQQRVAVARALRQQGELVLADEPVASVDPAWRERVLGLLVEDCASRGATLVASLHDVELALHHFTRVIGVRSGRIVFDRPADEIDDDLLISLYAAAPSLSR